MGEQDATQARRDAVAAEILALAIAHDAAGRIDDAIDVIFDRLDRLQLDGDFAQCDAVLAAVDPAGLSSSLRCSILTITAHAGRQGLLPSRAALYARVRELTVAEKGPERAARILDRLE